MGAVKQDLKEMEQLLNKQVGSSRSASGDVIPHHVHVCGFADFVNGNPPLRMKKLDETGYTFHAEQLTELVPHGAS